MAAIATRDLVKRFGRLTALADVTLDIAPGETVALLGSNGAGKSTLLRILGTSVLPDEGTVTVGGHDVEADPVAVRSSVGFMLPDERSWYWRLSGRHNLEFFATLHGLGREELAGRAEELLEEVGLAEAADRRFDGYSAGMRVRLSLARALIGEPPILLLDEPTRSVDPVGRKHFRDLLTAVAADRGTTVLLATHDLHEAAELAASTIVLAHGRVTATTEGRASVAELEQALLQAA